MDLITPEWILEKIKEEPEIACEAGLPITIVVHNMEDDIAKDIEAQIKNNEIHAILVVDPDVKQGKFAIDSSSTDEHGMLMEQLLNYAEPLVFKNFAIPEPPMAFIRDNNSQAKAGIQRLSRKHNYRG